MTARSFTIAGRRVGAGAPPLVIAEMSCNHMGSFERAMKILEAAAAAGAGAVKLQTLRPEGITLDSDRPGFQISGGLWDGRRLFELYARGMTVREIQGFLADMYGVEVSPDLISTVTDGIVAEVTAWQNRPLEAMYPVVFFDATISSTCGMPIFNED